jgi:hypothetical protein
MVGICFLCPEQDWIVSINALTFRRELESSEKICFPSRELLWIQVLGISQQLEGTKFKKIVCVCVHGYVCVCVCVCVCVHACV